MKRLSISAKIWLSVGVFIPGYILMTLLNQIPAMQTEQKLRATSENLFPAAQRSQEAESAFQRAVKGLSDAVVMQDAAGLERATKDGKSAVDNLRAVAGISQLPPGRAEEMGRLASEVERFSADASATYSAMLATPGNMTEESQAKMKDLAARTDRLKSSLQAAKDRSSRDLHEGLDALQARSAQQRWLSLVLFIGTLLVGGVIVNLTIRRAIIGPVLRVINGVQEAADQTAGASDRISESGQIVARGAQEQAACLEETSASLEEISATAQENAHRATEADRLMSEANQTVDRAMPMMNDLSASMHAISSSSREVSAVLRSLDEISFHTNILALNAAVEAARAGEAGAGFSVVADEVRALARRAADAARHSAGIVERTIADVNKGVELASVANQAFTEVSSKIGGGSTVVNQIAVSSEEQARGVRQIGQAIVRMQSVTQDNAQNAHQTADSASDLTDQVQITRRHLDELVAVMGLEQR